MRTVRKAGGLIVWILFGLVSARAGNVRQLRVDALRLYAEGRYQEALPRFDELLKSKPRDIESLNKRGCIYLRMNQPERALADFNAAARYVPFFDLDQQQMNRRFHPDVPGTLTANPYGSHQLYPSAFTNRGIAQMMLGNDDAALADFQHALNLHLSSLLPRAPGVTSAYSGIGQVYHHKGDDARALDSYDRALRYNRRDPNAHVGRGVALVGLGRPDEALECFNTALQLEPGHAVGHGHRALLYERLGREKDALADYETSLRLDPGAAMVRRYRGALLSRLGRHDAAVNDITEAIRSNPTDSGAYKDRGGTHSRNGDFARALRDLDEAVRLDPKNAKAYQNRAAAHNGLARYEAAIHDGDEAVRLDPNNAGARNNRGLALIGLGRCEAAIADLTEAIRLEPTLVPAYVNRGGAYRRLGMLPEAESDYEKALRLEPKLMLAETGLAQVRDLLRLRSSSEPMEVFSQADLATARRHRAEADALRARGDWSGAVASYSKALEADADDLESLAFRGWSRLIAGEPGAVADARLWLDRKGWRDPFAPYMALLGVLAARSEDQAKTADLFLDEAMANTRPPGWPAPLFRYLKRTMPSADLLAAADTPDHQSEAHLVIGLHLFLGGQRTSAMEPLRQAAEHGSERSIARALARATLDRIGAAGPKSSNAPAVPRP
jgi:tetratricopeptide (TPR) repeat protein